jgi:hypothetical protein
MHPAFTSLMAAGLIAVAAGSPARARTVPVSGQVTRSCVGPIIAGRPPRCFDRAVFIDGRRRVVVHGKFRVRLRRGTYRVTVDTCERQQTLRVRHAISGLSLVPHCPIPLAASREQRWVSRS